MTTATIPEPLSVACAFCAAPPNQGCESATGRPCEPHGRRVKLARALTAHADPVLDEHFPRRGACGICSVPGLDQRHRVIDAIADALTAGEDAEELAGDYMVSTDAVEAIRVWAAKWPGAWL